MDTLGSILVGIGSIAFLFGLVLCIHPIPSIGFSHRRDGGLVIIASLAIIALAQQISPTLKAEAAADAAASEAASAEQEIERKKIRLGGFSAMKRGGTKMTATFVIYNDSKRSIKDITVACTLAGNSGTVIQRTRNKVYEHIAGGSFKSIVDMDMGKIDPAVTGTSCRISNFEWA